MDELVSRHYEAPTWWFVCPNRRFLEWTAKLGWRAVVRWILDGDLSNLDLRLEFADTAVFLDLPWLVCLRGLVARHNRRRADYPDGVTEGLGWLCRLAPWVTWTYPRKRRPCVLRQLDSAPDRVMVVHLRSRAAVRTFLADIKQGV